MDRLEYERKKRAIKVTHRQQLRDFESDYLINISPYDFGDEITDGKKVIIIDSVEEEEGLRGGLFIKYKGFRKAVNGIESARRVYAYVWARDVIKNKTKRK